MALQQSLQYWIDRHHRGNMTPFHLLTILQPRTGLEEQIWHPSTLMSLLFLVEDKRGATIALQENIALFIT